MGSIFRIAKILFFAFIVLYGAVQNASAEEQTPVLLIEGSIKAGPGDIIKMSIADIRELGVSELTTETIWTDGPNTFKGVPLSTLLESHSLSGRPINVFALNDYTTTIPSEIVDKAFLAFEMDGVPLKPSDKGPLWVIFDFSSMPSKDKPLYQTYAIWQLYKVSKTNE